MTEVAQGHPAGQVTPAGPSVIDADPAAIRQADNRASGRASARAALAAALSGVELTEVDRRFVSRLSQWDKRNAGLVASLVTRARQRGQIEAGLTLRQRQAVLSALADAVAYRTSGAAAAACWDCANLASGLCADHARDADRARAFNDLAAALSRHVRPQGLARLGAVPELGERTRVAS